jgi:hypothetical protein
MTVMVGALLVHGVRFTTRSLYVDLATVPNLPRIWPASEPVPCGEHFICFPGVLAMEAMHSGKRSAFVTMCECEIAYLVVLEKDGAHFRNDGTLEAMVELIDC